MDTQCEHIEGNSDLTFGVDAASEPKKAYVVFANRSKLPLWFPDEQEPAYRPNEKTGTVTVWFGYIEEVYGEYAARYMIPLMRVVPPGSDLKVDLTSPDLIRRVIDTPASIRLAARIATKELRHSQTRGDQPLDDYMRNSCVVHSSGSTRRK